MDPPKQAPTGSARARRRMHQCPHCDEIFVDEESFEKHKLTHGEAAAAPPAAAAPAPAAPAPEAPAAEAPPARTPRAARAAAAAAAAAAANSAAPAAAAAPAAPAAAPAAETVVARPVSAVRQEAGIGGPPEILGDDLGEPMQFDDMAAGLGPMEWEQAEPRPNPLLGVFKFVEDFSEWLFHGLQKAASIFGLSLVPAIGIAIRGTVILLLCIGILGSGMFVGRKYGPWLLGQKADDPPLLPPQRVIPTVTDDTKLASQAVVDFYAAIDKKSYSVAYDALSADWQKELSFSEFERGYRNTQSVTCAITDSKTLADGRVEVKADIEVFEAGSSRKVTAVYQAKRTDSGWKLDSGTVKPV